MNKRLLGSYKFAAGNLGEPVSNRNVPSRENEFTNGPDSTAKEYFFGRRWPRHHWKVLDAAAYGGEEENLNKLLLTTAMAAMISAGAMAQSTVVTTTGAAHAAALQHALVERLNGGWRITEKDRTVLEFMENTSFGPQTELDVPVEHLSAAEPAPKLSPPQGVAEANACSAAERHVRERVRRRPDSSSLVQDREKQETFRTAWSCQRLNAVAGAQIWSTKSC